MIYSDNKQPCLAPSFVSGVTYVTFSRAFSLPCKSFTELVLKCNEGYRLEKYTV